MSIVTPDQLPEAVQKLEVCLGVNAIVQTHIDNMQTATREEVLSIHDEVSHAVHSLYGRHYDTTWRSRLRQSTARVQESLNSCEDEVSVNESHLQAMIFDVFTIPHDATLIGNRILDGSVGHYGARIYQLDSADLQLSELAYHENRMGSTAFALAASLLTRTQIEACLQCVPQRNKRLEAFAIKAKRLLKA